MISVRPLDAFSKKVENLGYAFAPSLHEFIVTVGFRPTNNAGDGRRTNESCPENRENYCPVPKLTHYPVSPSLKERNSLLESP